VGLGWRGTRAVPKTINSRRVGSESERFLREMGSAEDVRCNVPHTRVGEKTRGWGIVWEESRGDLHQGKGSLEEARPRKKLVGIVPEKAQLKRRLLKRRSNREDGGGNSPQERKNKKT